MRTGDLLAAAVWLTIALGVAVAGLDLGLGTLSNPGSGFMIFWVGAAMTGLSLSALVVAARQPAEPRLAALWEGTRWWLVPYVSALLVLYAVLLPIGGFLACTFVLLLVLFRTIDPQGWGMSLLIAAASTAVADVVFHRWLGTQLPAGTLVERLPWTF